MQNYDRFYDANMLLAERRVGKRVGWQLALVRLARPTVLALRGFGRGRGKMPIAANGRCYVSVKGLY